VRAPVLAQELERGVGERDVAVLASLAVDLDKFAVAVHVGDLKPCAFHEAEAAGVDGGEAGAVHWHPDAIEDPPDLLSAQNNRKLFLTLGPGDLEDHPLAAQGVLVEELEAAEGNGVGAAGDFLDGGEVEEVVTELLFREGVGRGMIEAGQLGDGADVRLHGAIGVAAELEVLDHPFAEWCHGVLTERVQRQHRTSLRQRHPSRWNNSTHRNRSARRRQAD